MTASGQVKNITDQKIKNLRAMVTWYDAQNNMVTYNSSYVEHTTLMPKQVTPFRVMERHNPLMKSATVDFVLDGRRVQWIE